ASNYVYIGQMKKLSWILQPEHVRRFRRFSSSSKQRTRWQYIHIVGKLSKARTCLQSTLFCSMYVMRLYYSCKIHKRISFIALDEQPIQHKITKCVEGCD
ncbi:hypothetical protein PHYSODRAFT_529158, partial [Phytophthora sojae]